VPLAVRLVAALIGAMLLVAGFPALTAMTAEVVPAAIRGLTFSVTTFLSALVSAASPLLIGGIADQFDYVMPNGDIKGNLGYAFLIVTPLVFIGGFVVLRGAARRLRHLHAVELAPLGLPRIGTVSGRVEASQTVAAPRDGPRRGAS
jgi:MFS family permease